PLSPVHAAAAASAPGLTAVTFARDRVISFVDPVKLACIFRLFAVMRLRRAPTVESAMVLPMPWPAPAAATFAADVAWRSRFFANPCMLGRTLIQTAPTVAKGGHPPQTHVVAYSGVSADTRSE